MLIQTLIQAGGPRNEKIKKLNNSEIIVARHMKQVADDSSRWYAVLGNASLSSQTTGSPQKLSKSCCWSGHYQIAPKLTQLEPK